MKRRLGIVLALSILNSPFLALGSENVASGPFLKDKLKIAGQIAKSSFWLNQAVDWSQGFIGCSMIAWVERHSMFISRGHKSPFWIASCFAGLFGGATVGATIHGSRIAINEFRAQMNNFQPVH